MEAAKSVKIAGREVGPGRSVYVIAEAGINHDGDVSTALALVDAAAKARADAVKFQTFRAQDMVVRGTPKARYQVETTGPGSMDDMGAQLELPPEAYRALADRAKHRGLDFLSSPFGEDAVDLLSSLGVPAMKIASGEVTNVPLLRKIASARLPVILSTGMSDLDEVGAALDVLRSGGAADVVLLHCVSSYPAPVDDLNLRAIETLARTFRVPVGWSDHTVGMEVPWTAVALGACVVERHLTLDRRRSGPDHRASTEPDDFLRMVEGIRLVERALGDGIKRMRPCEEDVRRVARRSVVTKRPVEAGATIVLDDLAVKRPGTGIPPGALSEVVGRRPRRDLAADTVLTWDVLS